MGGWIKRQEHKGEGRKGEKRSKRERIKGTTLNYKVERVTEITRKKKE